MGAEDELFIWGDEPDDDFNYVPRTIFPTPQGFDEARKYIERAITAFLGGEQVSLRFASWFAADAVNATLAFLRAEHSGGRPVTFTPIRPGGEIQPKSMEEAIADGQIPAELAQAIDELVGPRQEGDLPKLVISLQYLDANYIVVIDPNRPADPAE